MVTFCKETHILINARIDPNCIITVSNGEKAMQSMTFNVLIRTLLASNYYQRYYKSVKPCSQHDIDNS